MSTTQTVTCNRCLAVILEDRTKCEIISGPLRHCFGEDDGFDLCRDCATALNDWMHAREASDFVREPELSASSL